MASLRYALVAYVRGPVGEFVENLRRELHPELPHFAAHLTLLPPRPLQGTEGAALQVLAGICGRTEPLEVTLGGMDSFAPTTPTVYIRVSYGAMRMCELHEQLNTQALEFVEEWAYIPHLTIAKMPSESAAEQALRSPRLHPGGPSASGSCSWPPHRSWLSIPAGCQATATACL